MLGTNQPLKLTELLIHWFKAEFGMDMYYDSTWMNSDYIYEKGDACDHKCPTFSSMSVRSKNPRVILRCTSIVDTLLLHPEEPGFLGKVAKYYGLSNEKTY